MKTLAGWQAEIGAWAVQTFGPGVRFRQHVEHIRRELYELSGEVTDDRVAEEMADVLSLLLAMAHRRGIDLEAALASKFAVNRKRKWGEPNADGVIEHVRE